MVDPRSYSGVGDEGAATRYSLPSAAATARGKKISYAELWQRVQSVGQAMIDLGARRGDRLAISLRQFDRTCDRHVRGDVGRRRRSSDIAELFAYAGGLARLQDIATLLRPRLFSWQDSEIYSSARKIPEFASAMWIAADQKAGSVSIRSLYETRPARSSRRLSFCR